MKKLSLLLVAFALVTGLSQCSKKPVMPSYSGPAGDRIIQNVTLNATQSNGGGDSKIAEDGLGKVKWEKGDIIIVKQGGEQVGELTCTKPETNEFTGTIAVQKGSEQDKLTFAFCTENFKEDFLNQTGALNDAIKLSSDPVGYEPSGDYGVVEMTMPHAVLKLDLSDLGTADGTTVTITADGVVAASVSTVKNTSTEVYVAVPESGVETTYGFICNVVSASVKWTLKKNTFYTSKTETGAAIKIKPSEFTVGMDDGDKPRKVNFSNGNLYWDGSTFHFEDSQTAYTTERNPNHVDRFYWSKTASVACATYYNDSEFSDNDLFFTNDPSFQVYGETTGIWRTLSRAEWGYLIGESNPGRSKNLRGWSTMTLCESDSTVNGLIIMPDGWEGTLAATTDYTTWKNLEASGAVFLPAAGGHYADTVYDIGRYSNYWSSTPVNEKVCYMCSSKDGPGTYETIRNDSGFPVRLVR